MGILRSPHEATCPSIASRISHEGAFMSSFTTISPDKLARLIGTANTPVLIDVRTDEDFAADPRLIPGAVRRKPPGRPPTGAENFRAAPPSWSASAAEAFARAPRPGCDMPELRPKRWRAASKPGRPPSCRWCRRDKLPAARRAGPHRLGHARAAEDRPHRLPLADPPVRRSERGVPVRGARRGGRRSASVSTPHRSTSKTCSGAIAANSAPST